MTELTQALLNTCVVSPEAQQELESIISGGGTQGLELYEVEYNIDGSLIYLSLNFNQLSTLLKSNKYPYFRYLDNIYYFWEADGSMESSYHVSFEAFPAISYIPPLNFDAYTAIDNFVHGVK